MPQPETTELALASAAAAAVAVESALPQTPNPVQAEPDVMAVAEPEPQTAPEAPAAEEPVQVASIAPLAGLEEATQEDMGAADMIQYSQRLAEFNTDLLRMVYGSVHYPKAAVRRGLQGTLELDLVLTEDGALRDVIIARSSGHKILDQAALKAAERAFKGETLAGIDAVVSEEYGNGGDSLVVPVPIKFILTE